MPKNDYYQHYKELIKNVLDKSEVMIACDPNDDDFFFGYMIVRIVDDIKIVHYCYTKKPFRRFGVQRKLLEHFELTNGDPIIITCRKPDFLTKIETLYKPELKKI